MPLGGVEILIIAIIGLVFLALPIATLILLFLIYQKVNQIERRLDQSSDKG